MAAFDFSQSFSGINNALSNLGKQNDTRWLREAQADVGKSLLGGDYNSAAQKAFGYGDAQTGLGLLKLGEQVKDRSADAALIQGLPGIGGAAVPQAPVAPIALGNPNEIENRFVNTVKSAGLTNPVGLGAVAAYGKAESGYAPQNVNRAWSDPSESGQPGTAGGIMSWRADRLQNLQNFARQRGEQQPSVETQALFLAQEDPTLIPKLNAARTPQEANQIMANAWRFAGYNREGGENARRLALTQGYAQRFAGQGGDAPPVPVQVAQNEADVQRLDAQQGNPVVGAQPPVQMAQAAPQPGSPIADVPAQGAVNAEFVIPGTTTTVDQQTLAGNPRIQNMVRALAAARTEKAQTAIKQALELEIADAKQKQAINQPTDVQKNYEAARRQGYQGTFFDYQQELRKAGSTNVNVNSGEKTYDQTVGKAQGEYFVATQQGARDARDQITTMKRMQSLIDDPNFYSGWNGGRATAFKKLAVSLGIKDAEAAAPNELFEKLSKQAVLDKAGGSFGTGFSNGDRDYIDATTANPNNTPEGNRQILDAAIKIAQRKIEVAKMARDYAKANSGRLDGGFDDLVSDFAEKNPLFPQTAKPQQQATPAPAAPQQQEAPRQVQTIDDVRGLPSGTVFIDPNGVRRRVP